MTLEGLSSTLHDQQAAYAERAAQLDAREAAQRPREEAVSAAEALLREQAQQMEADKVCGISCCTCCSVYFEPGFRNLQLCSDCLHAVL